MENRSTPAISVCVPIYNGRPFLERCFDSLAHQTFRDFEVVVVDDGSTDDSATLAADHMRRHGLIGRVLRIPNGGCEQARDIACMDACAPIIAPFDCDDYWEPDYLVSMLAALRSHRDIDLVYCDFIEEHTDTGVKARKSDSVSWVDLSRAKQAGNLYRFAKGEFFSMLLQGQVLFPPCTMFKRSLYENAGVYADLPDLRVSLDWSFGLRASRVGGVAFLHRPLLRKYVHGGNVSADPVRTMTSDLRVIRSLLRNQPLTRAQRHQIKTLGAARAVVVAYAMRTTHRKRLQALKWSLASLGYAWNLTALKLALTTLVPLSILDRRREAQNSRAAA